MRTRRELLRAAQELVEAGRAPTVAEAADAALVSRATAYRYFPSQEALLREAALLPDLPDFGELFTGTDAPLDAEDRVALVHEVLFDHIREREAQFRLFHRTQLLQSLEPGSAERTLRPAYRVALLDAALAPFEAELGQDRSERLKHALGVLIGTEAVIAVRDVLQLDHDTARDHLGWACRMLVRTALADARHERRAL